MITGNYSSLLELAAGLNVAYIAVDYSMNGYTNILSNKFFEFPEKIKNAFATSESILCEKKTLESLKETGGGIKNLEFKKEVGINIEKSIRDFEKLEEKIRNTKIELNNDIQKDCESKNFSSLSFCMFLFCIISLFLSGFYSTIDKQFNFFLELFNAVLGIFLFVYIFVGWVKNNNTQIKTRILTFDYSKLNHSLIYFLSVLVLSLTASCLIQNYDYIISISIIYWINTFLVIFPFLNFIAFVFIIRKKGKFITTKISNEAKEIEKECEQAKKEVEELIIACNFVARLSTE